MRARRRWRRRRIISSCASLLPRQSVDDAGTGIVRFEHRDRGVRRRQQVPHRPERSSSGQTVWSAIGRNTQVRPYMADSGSALHTNDRSRDRLRAASVAFGQEDPFAAHRRHGHPRHAMLQLAQSRPRGDSRSGESRHARSASSAGDPRDRSGPSADSSRGNGSGERATPCIV